MDVRINVRRAIVVANFLNYVPQIQAGSLLLGYSSGGEMVTVSSLISGCRSKQLVSMRHERLLSGGVLLLRFFCAAQYIN